MHDARREEQSDALVDRITEAWFKLTEFGTAAFPVERGALEVRREGRVALAELLTELEDLSPGSFGHDPGQVLSGALHRLADEQPRALVYLLSEALNRLADRRRA
jgi:hypothetical protein